MTDIALLGFAVDSAPLTEAEARAFRAAQKIGALGDAADKTSEKLTKTGRSAGNTSKDAEKLARDMLKANEAFEKFARGLNLTEGATARTATGFGLILQRAAAMSPAMLAGAGHVDTLAASLGGVGGGTVSRGLVGGLGAASSRLAGLVAGLGPAGAGMAAVAAGTLIVAGAYYKAAESLAVYQDRQTQNEARLKNALGEGSDAAGTVSALQDQANEAGIAADSTIDAFARIARNGEALGASTQQLLQLSETVQKLGIVSNASAGEIASGQLQLSQALASGKLNGDELRSVMENLPALAKAIADGLGVSVGQLRSMGAAGELTGDKVFKALLSQTDKVREEFKSLPDTTERAFTRLENQSNKFKARLGELIQASQFMQFVINGAAAAFERLNGTAPTTIQGITERVNALTAQKLGMAEGGVANFLTGSGRYDARNVTQLYKINQEIAELQRSLTAVQRREAGTKVADAAKAETAELARILGIAKDIDDAGTRKSKLASDQKALQEGLALAKKTMAEAAKEAEEYTNKVNGLNGAIAYQFARASNPLNTTENAVANFLMNGKGQLNDKRAEAEKAAAAARARAEEARKAAAQIQASMVVNNRSIEGAAKSDPTQQRRDELDGLARQTSAQIALAGAVGKSRAATRELEIAQEAADYRVRTFGNKSTPEAITATNAYALALRKLKAAQDSVADARAFQTVKDNIAGLKARTDAIGAGEYAVRRAAAQQAADLANRETPGLGRAKMREFDANEALSAAQQVQSLKTNQLRTTERIAAIGNAAAERQLALETRVNDAKANAVPGQRAAVEAAIRADDAATRLEQEGRSNRSNEDRLAMLAEERTLMQYTGRELSIQTALLQKRKELEAQGIDAASAYYQQQMKTAGVIAGQVFDNDKTKSSVEDMRLTVRSGFDGLRDAGKGVFSDLFRNGEVSAGKFFDRLGSGLASFAEKLAEKVLLNPLFNLLTNDQGTGALDGILNGVASALGSVFGAPKKYALGGAFLGGHEVALAGGGVLHGPTMFRMAGGKTGVAGEAGAEGVLPLRRGPSGRLGVESSGSGGGTLVQIIDQRSNTGSEPVEVQERNGDGGQRFIYVTVRDSVKASMRSGELDTDMRGQFGVGRPVIRR